MVVIGVEEARLCFASIAPKSCGCDNTTSLSQSLLVSCKVKDVNTAVINYFAQLTEPLIVYLSSRIVGTV